MAYFFVDCENVGIKGLRYADYLNKTDKLFLFYSSACLNAEKGIMDKVLESGCELHCYKLEKPQKDANDCRIMCEVSYFLGVDSNSDEDFIIISNDKIFENLIRFYSDHPDVDRRRKLVRRPDLISAIIATTDKAGRERRRILQDSITTVSIDEMFGRYKAANEYKVRIKEAFEGTKLDKFIPDICELFEAKRQGRALYLSALKLFGKVNGTTVYNKLKSISIDLEASA